ncbi:MAG: M15 family metallopeptidase [Gemmataceae bacterium]|nr:M15 family metallopeptidase [Gemmataceae bacterium]
MGGDSSRWTQDKKLRSLNPLFRAKVGAVLARLRKRGFQPSVFYGWRSVAVQRELDRLRRTKVTFSSHNAQRKDGTANAYAADIVDARWGWAPAAKANGFWAALGEEAKAAGLVWGGSWATFPDLAHVPYHPNSPLAQVKRESGL